MMNKIQTKILGKKKMLTLLNIWLVS